MKQRKFKFSLGMKIASILSCIALVSVGFATWWIVQLPEPAPLEEGSFTVYTVDTKNIKIENLAFSDVTPARNPVVSSSRIIFGKTSGVTENWLLARDIEEQNLTATITFDVNLYDNYEEGKTNSLGTGAIKDYVGNINLLFSPTATTNLDNAINDGYITAPKITYSYGTGNTDSVDYNSGDTTLAISMEGATGNTVAVTVTIVFGWGEAFDDDGTADEDATDNLNPYVFYNANGKAPNGDSGVAKEEGTGNMTWAQHADKALTAISGLSGVEYNVTLTATLAS